MEQYPIPRLKKEKGGVWGKKTDLFVVASFFFLFFF